MSSSDDEVIDLRLDLPTDKQGATAAETAQSKEPSLQQLADDSIEISTLGLEQNPSEPPNNNNAEITSTTDDQQGRYLSFFF